MKEISDVYETLIFLEFELLRQWLGIHFLTFLDSFNIEGEVT